MQSSPPHPSTKPTQTRRLHRPDSRTLLLAFVGLLMLLMPVTYRAGTETSHVHTNFQGMIDAIAGHPHHHHHDTHTAACEALVVANAPPVSLFGAAAFPPSGADHDHSGRSHTSGSPADETNGSLTSCADTPEVLGMSSPIESTSAIDRLGELVALLLGGAACLACWSAVNRLVEVCLPLEPPPPRPA